MQHTIIGGGIGGIMTALCFEKLGIAYQLYEKAERIEAIGAGIWLAPNALQVIEWVSPLLLKKIMDSGKELDQITIAKHNLKTISTTDQTVFKQKFGFSTIAIHRGKLQQILFSFANQNNINLNRTFDYFTIKNDHIQVKFANGSSIESQFLIGADGIHSKIRQQLFPNSTLKYAGQTCWRGVADYSLSKKIANTGLTLWGKGLQFGISQLEEEKVYWFAVKKSKPNLTDDPQTVKNKLMRLFADYAPLVRELIHSTPETQIIRGNLSDLNPLKQWNKNNICLIGDAAHAMTPDLGQGGGQAIEDAYYLSKILEKNDHVPDAFQKFSAYRMPKVNKLVKQSRATSKMAIKNKPFEFVRNLSLKLAPQSLLKRQMMQTYSIDENL